MKTPIATSSARALLATLVAVAWAACSTPPAPQKPDEPPVAEAGPDQSVALGTQITLDGSASSDPDDQPLSYLWSPDPGNPGTVVLTNTRLVRFTPVAPGRYVFVLVVSADQVLSEPDSVTVTVVGTDNTEPVARAGPDYALPVGSAFFLDGSTSTDAEDDSLRFLWEVVDAAGDLAIADSSAAQTGFVPVVPGTYTFRLTVSDGVLAAVDEVTILVTGAGNLAPVADAGPNQTVAVGSLVTLDGSDSVDPDGDPLSFRWSVGNNPGEAVTLADSLTATPTFTPNLLGLYVFGLVVDDGESPSLLDTMVVEVVARIYTQRSGMIEVPTGTFDMGSEGGLAGESPVHRVTVSTFWVDSVEVTAGQFALCVNAGACSSPDQQPGCNFGLEARSAHPVNCVDYSQAASFCAWAGKRLPTEAEWEKTARGPNDDRRYPWGDDDPNLLLISEPSLQLLNYNNHIGATAVVGQHPDGRSPYGVHNLAGNVMEWVADYYDPEYYASSPDTDPQGPTTGEQRVARGGHYLATPQAVTATVRNRTAPATRAPVLGFRCARTAPPP